MIEFFNLEDMPIKGYWTTIDDIKKICEMTWAASCKNYPMDLRVRYEDFPLSYLYFEVTSGNWHDNTVLDIRQFWDWGTYSIIHVTIEVLARRMICAATDLGFKTMKKEIEYAKS